jgi:hypothetical protein
MQHQDLLETLETPDPLEGKDLQLLETLDRLVPMDRMDLQDRLDLSILEILETLDLQEVLDLIQLFIHYPGQSRIQEQMSPLEFEEES